MTVQSTALVADLKALVLRLEDDLRERVQTQPEVLAAWQEEHRRAAAAERTASTWQAWRDDRVTQAAVAWVLTTVFVRFCEDNALLRPVWISGPPNRRQEALDAEAAYFRAHPEDTHREWLLQAVEHLRRMPATAALVDARSALWTVSPSGRAATELLGFWRETTESGDLVRDFADPTLDTRFLGDLYQDLSEHAKKTYALLQTPDFVEEFILDRTLEPALAERSLEGFKMIDPACGSGHFLLGAFARFLDRWQRHAPGLEPRVRVQKALDAVWGVDINPFAVAIARLRLLLAALNAVGATSLEWAPDFTINVLAGDSLYFSHNQDALFLTRDDFAYAGEDKDALVAALARGQYDAVVANPPYITVTDKALNEAYRRRYSYVRGKYQLTAPFMELLFALAKRGTRDIRAGLVGQITSNGFMKREFGVPLVQELLPKLDLTSIVDSEGAWIPGHNMDGTPTVMIFGRNQSPQSPLVRAVLSRGLREPRVEDPDKQGPYWNSIMDHIDSAGFSNQWISVMDMDRNVFRTHPWTLRGGASSEVLSALEKSGRHLASMVMRIGVFGMTIADDAMVTDASVPGRLRLEDPPRRDLVLGEAVRDFRISQTIPAWFPYNASHSLLSDGPFPAWRKYLWPNRTTLAGRPTFGGKTYREDGRYYYEWHQLPRDGGAHPWLVTFAFISSHNHFVLDRGGRVFNRSAPVVKLHETAGEDDFYFLLGVLNSSVACFWLRQVSQPKGGAADLAWSRTFEFSGTTLLDFPLPEQLPFQHAHSLDSLAQELSAQQVLPLVASDTPTAERLRDAEVVQTSLIRRMIAHQEELDWQVYSSYGLVDEQLTYPIEPPQVALGERAFEIVLARGMAASAEESAWFSRHRSTPITEIPTHWPQDYRELVQRRIDAIESVDAIRLLEAPEYKRRWFTEAFAVQAEKALRNWLLDRLEARHLWFSRQGHPTPKSVAQLADDLGRDAEFVSVVELWRRKGVRLVDALGVLLEPESVPYLAAHRLKDPGLRKFVDWQRTWVLQRQEDDMRPAEDAPEAEKKAANARADEFAATIPVPPKYTSADFRKPSYWSARGKLDVPKERFIAYPDAGRSTDPTALLGWAGWDHAQQSLALATIIAAREADGVSDEVLVPLVAGMAELQPWVQQWHAEVDPAFGQSPAEFTGQELARRARQVGRSLEQLAAWRPPAATRGRRAKA